MKQSVIALIEEVATGKVFPREAPGPVADYETKPFENPVWDAYDDRQSAETRLYWLASQGRDISGLEVVERPWTWADEDDDPGEPPVEPPVTPPAKEPDGGGFAGDSTISDTAVDVMSGEAVIFDHDVNSAPNSVGEPAIYLPESGEIIVEGFSTPSTKSPVDGRQIHGLMFNPWRGMKTHGDRSRQGLDDGRSSSGKQWSSDYAPAADMSLNVDPGYTGHPIIVDLDADRVSFDSRQTWTSYPNLSREGFVLYKAICHEDPKDFGDRGRMFARHLIEVHFIPHGTRIPERFATRGARGDQSKVIDLDKAFEVTKGWATVDVPQRYADPQTTPLRSAGHAYRHIANRGLRPSVDGLSTYGWATMETIRGPFSHLIDIKTSDEDRRAILDWLVPAMAEMADTMLDGDRSASMKGAHMWGPAFMTAALALITGEDDVAELAGDNSLWAEMHQSFIVGDEHVDVQLGQSTSDDSFPRLEKNHVGLPWFGLLGGNMEAVNLLLYAHPFNGRAYGSAYTATMGDMMAVVMNIPGMVEMMNAQHVLHYVDAWVAYEKLFHAGIRTNVYNHYVKTSKMKPAAIALWEQERDNVSVPRLKGLQPYPAHRPYSVDTSSVDVVVQEDEAINLNDGTLQRVDVLVRATLGENAPVWVYHRPLIIEDVKPDAEGKVTIPNGTLPGDEQLQFTFLYTTEHGTSAVGRYTSAQTHPDSVAPAYCWSLPSMSPRVITQGAEMTVHAGKWTGAASLAVGLQITPDDGSTWETVASWVGVSGDQWVHTASEPEGVRYRVKVVPTNSDAGVDEPETMYSEVSSPMRVNTTLDAVPLAAGDSTVPALPENEPLAGRRLVLLVGARNGDVIPTVDRGEVKVHAQRRAHSNAALVYELVYDEASQETNLTFSETAGGNSSWAIFEILKGVPAVLKARAHELENEFNYDMTVPVLNGGLWFGVGASNLGGGTKFDGPDVTEVPNAGTSNARVYWCANTTAPKVQANASVSNDSEYMGSVAVSVALVNAVDLE